MTVELYFFQPLGSNSARVYLTLLEKGVDFIERELSGHNFEHLQPAYLKINPKGQVPCVVHDGLVLTEGMTINEYIDETFEGPSLRPADLRERWMMRVWCRYAEVDLGRCLMMIHWNRIVPIIVGARDMEEVDKIIESVPDPDRRRTWRSAFTQTTPPEQMEESHRRVREGTQRMEKLFTKQRWLAGSTYSLADIDFYNFCGMMALWMPDEVNEKDTPAVLDWFQMMEERPAVKELRARTKGLPTQHPAKQKAG